MTYTLDTAGAGAAILDSPDALISTRRPAHDLEVRTSLELISELYNYNHWIFNKVRPFIRGKVCEVGAGIGNITQFLLNHEEVVGLEPSPVSSNAYRKRFSAHSNISCCERMLSRCPAEGVPADHFDTTVCLNVLEHIEEDVDALDTMRRLCRPGGRVVILVPAHMSIYGRIDRAFGHVRRYNRRSLSRAFRNAGLSVEYSFYMNSLGFFGWLWHSKCLQRPEIPIKAARLFNRLVPFVDAFERVIRLPFVQSVVMIGKRSACA